MFDRESLQTEEFSWKKALSLAMASELAYQEHAGVVDVTTARWGFDESEIIDVGDTEGFVTWDSHVVVISFRGTESFGDWLGNLELVSTERSYGDVHQGFFKAFDLARERVETILQQASAAGKKVWLTGHSLGASVASIAGAELLDSLAIAGFYTYGQPKTGDAQFRQFYQRNYGGKFVRVVNDDDVVPQVPPGYTHIGQLVWFDGDGNLQRNDTSPESGGLEDVAELHEMDVDEFKQLQAQMLEMEDLEDASIDELAGFGPAEGFFPSFSDHGIDRYIGRIRRFANSAVGADGRL